jgi:hypothetical protein
MVADNADKCKKVKENVMKALNDWNKGKMWEKR